MPAKINIQVGNKKFAFKLMRDKCTNLDLILLVTALELAKSSVLREIAKTMKVDVGENTWH